MLTLLTLTVAGAGASLFSTRKLLYKRHNSQQQAVFITAFPTAYSNGNHASNDVAVNGHENHPALSSLEYLRQQGQPLKQSLVTALSNTEEAYQQFVKTKIDPLFQGKRHALLEELEIGDDDNIILTPYERQINRKLALSGLITGVAIATASLPFAVQFATCVPLALYLVRDIYQRAYSSIKEERRLTFFSLIATNQTLLWFGGYFTLGGVIFILTNVGQKMNYISEVQSRRQLVNIFGQLPPYVWVLRQGVETKISFDALEVADILIVRTGQMIPVDGVIINGYASIDQHRLTGESQPAEKGVGDDVLAATVVLAGKIEVRVEKTGQATVAAQIGEMLQKTASYQMSILSKAQQIASKSVTPTYLAAGLAWLFVGWAGAVAITSTMLGLNIWLCGPLALRNYLSVATRKRVLVKDGRSLDLLTEIDTLVFDKTGTLTLDQPHITHIHTFANFDAADVLRYAATVEQHQSHPIARAILEYAKEQAVAFPDLDESRYDLGYGLQATIEGKRIRVGSDRFMTLEGIPLGSEVEALQTTSHTYGHSLVMVAINDQLAGAIELQPTIRPEAKEIINELRQYGIDFYIISGDQEGPTQALARTLGIDNYFANTLPENKAQLVEQLQQEGRAVCFIGDGINDSIALKKSNVSISLRGSTTIAMDTAQIVLMDSTLKQLPFIFQLARDMEKNLDTTYKLAVIPGLGIWAGVFFLNLGILGATLIFEGSLWVGMANAMRPLWKYKEEQENNETTLSQLNAEEDLGQLPTGENKL